MNDLEQVVARRYEARGWTVLPKGWPDMLLVRRKEDGSLELKAVEVKSEKDSLKPHQKEVLSALSCVMPVAEVKEYFGYGERILQEATLDADLKIVYVDEIVRERE